MWILLHSWSNTLDRRFLADIIVNIVLYVPLGMAGYLAFRKHRIAGPVVLGMVLSACIEMAQLFVPGRYCSAVDLVNNTLGSALGVICGLLFEQLAGPGPISFSLRKLKDRPALALLFCWVGSLLFPLFPVMHLSTFRDEFIHFRQAPLLQAVPFISDAASWFVAGRLLLAAGVESPSAWLGVALLLVPAQFLIVTRDPVPVNFIGSIAGFILFVFAGPRAGRQKVWAGVFVVVLLIRGLAPFNLTSAHTFHWVPFEGFLNTDWQAGLRILLEKMFYYGTAIWLLRAAGLRWRSATGIIAIVLAAIEILQTHLPGRTPEITDPLLAILAGFGLYTLSRRQKSDAELRPPVLT